MPFGPCGLCHIPRELRLSHLLPAGVFAIVRSGMSAEDRHPVLITPRNSFFSSKEARAHLLDDECEERFNQLGEDWTLKNCWRSPTEFNLRDALKRTRSVEVEPGHHVFVGTAVTGVDMQQLVYFAISVFWRAAACRWRIDEGPTQRLALGSYEERLRAFLLADGAPLPSGVALWIGVSAAVEERYNRVAEYPAPSKASGFHLYRLTVPGLTFVMFVGQQLPPLILAYCASRAGTLLMSAEADALKLQHFLRLVKAAPRRGKLRALGY